MILGLIIFFVFGLYVVIWKVCDFLGWFGILVLCWFGYFLVSEELCGYDYMCGLNGW